MQTLKFTVLLCLLTLSYSCSKKCDDSKICAAIPGRFESMLPYDVGQSLTFVNDKGESLTFEIRGVDHGNARPVACFLDKRDGGVCHCNCNVQEYYSAFTVDTTRIEKKEWRKLFFGVRDVSDGMASSFQVDIDILNSGFHFINIEPLNFIFGEKILDSVQFGKLTHYNVIVCESNTNMAAYSGQPQIIEKAYFNLSRGLLGFYDLHTESLFYLE